MDPPLQDADVLEQERELYSRPMDSSDLPFLPGHHLRPCYVTKNGNVYVEMWHTGDDRDPTDPSAQADPEFAFKRINMSKRATEFLTAIAEPQSRPENVHHYLFTSYSILAGLSLGEKHILTTLQSLTKHVLPSSVVRFIQYLMHRFGKLSMVLRRGRVFVESRDPAILQTLMRNETIRGACIFHDYHVKPENANAVPKDLMQIIRRNINRTEEIHEDLLVERNLPSLEIIPEQAGFVKQEALALGFPMIEEYSYTDDDLNPDLDMRLKHLSKLRYYQREALGRMFNGTRARSGTIVLPCGAGKTLTGIAAACTISKSTLVLCSNNIACKQWIAQFQHFTDINPLRLIEFTSGCRVNLPTNGSAIVMATTYSMMSTKDDLRAESSFEVVKEIRAREWGLVILDEVHMAPVDSFRRALFEVKTHCKLGLTATLVREDGQIGDLNFLVGPKLYEANWSELTEQGFLARVMCAEVICPMSQTYMSSYLLETDEAKRNLLSVMNPLKFEACKFLMEKHEAANDKILIFSDSIASVRQYGLGLRRHMMYGETKSDEREELLRRFRMPSDAIVHPPAPGPINTLILSKIGDVAIDLPDANVIIQVSSHCGSRRQEAQRLGRILRPKSMESSGRFDSVFYSLVSEDTTEATVYAPRRREYVINQGYTYKVITWEMLGLPPVSEWKEDTKAERAKIRQLLSSKDSLAYQG